MWFIKLLLLIVFCGSIQNWVKANQRETQVHLIKIVDEGTFNDDNNEELTRNLFNPSSIRFLRDNLRAANP